MSQSDIYELLKNKRLSGNHSYFSSEDIRKELINVDINLNKASISNNLLKLRVFGYLDTEIKASKKHNILKTYVAYRLKKEYTN